MNKIRKGEDKTLARNNVKYWLRLIKEYESVKNKKHLQFKFVSEFYKHYGLTRQNFIKYYNRFKRNNRNTDYLLPQKRGPRYKLRRIPKFIENKVINLRSNGLSRYEIFITLEEKLKKFTPSPSTIYNISKRNGLNRLKAKEKKSKRMIIKERPGQLGHVDCHYLPKGLIENDNNRYYLVAVVDSLTRVAWVEVVANIKAITVMFNVLKALNMINIRYSVKFEEILSDNGSEFGSGKNANNKDEHPFELLLKEMGIKHRYTKPYRPQTNGKVERFWRTLNDDLLEDTTFNSLDHFKDELQQYLLYYNEIRPHQGINQKTPKEFRENLLNQKAEK